MSGFLWHWKGISEGEPVDTNGIILIDHAEISCTSLGKLMFFLHPCRFPLALEQFSDSMQMVKKKITPGKLTWPTTKVIVEETKLDYFKVRSHLWS